MSAERKRAHRSTRAARRIFGRYGLFTIVISALVIALAVAINVDANMMLRTALMLSIPAAILAFVSRGPSRHVPYHKTNRKPEERRANLIDLLERADHSVLIVTGSLNPAIYDDDEVVAAFRDLPKAVKITLIYTGEINPESARLIQILVDRRVRPRRARELVRHTVIVDDRDTKIEEFGVKDDAPEKRADYFYDDTSAARRVKSEINALQTTPGQFPSVGALAM